MVDIVPQKSGFALGVERYGPLVLSAFCMVLIYFYGPLIVAKFAAVDGWDISSLYGAVFNWSAIQTGFAFGVYGFVVGKSDGFIKEIRDTLAMRRVMGYVKRANIGGFLLTIFSLPLTVSSPLISGTHTVWFFVLLIWFGLFVWTFLAFLRIAYNFGHLSSVRDQPEFYGA